MTKVKTITIEDIKRAVVEECSKYNVAKAALIGSRAEGTNAPDSDIDPRALGLLGPLHACPWGALSLTPRFFGR